MAFKRLTTKRKKKKKNSLLLLIEIQILDVTTHKNFDNKIKK